MMLSNICKATVILLLNIPAVYADTIYKSVDENGNVSYSTTPPADNTDSNIVNIAPPPSEENIKAAKKRQEKNMEAARQFDENRQTRNEMTEKENQQKRENQKQKQLQLDWKLKPITKISILVTRCGRGVVLCMTGPSRGLQRDLLLYLPGRIICINSTRLSPALADL